MSLNLISLDITAEQQAAPVDQCHPPLVILAQAGTRRDGSKCVKRWQASRQGGGRSRRGGLGPGVRRDDDVTGASA